ncbi:hypothetical protein NQ315_004824, partial [Exocentrus adspersus]
YLMVCLKNKDLQVATADALIALITQNCEKCPYYVSLEARLKTALCSRLPEILGQMLEIADENIYEKLLKMMEVLLKESDTSCKIFVRLDVLNSLLMRLEPTWSTRFPNKPPPAVPKENVLHYDQTSINLLILTRYLLKNEKHMKDVNRIRLFSLWNLMYAYRWFISTNQPLNRNSVLVILFQLMKIFPSLDFVSSGLAVDLTFVGFDSAISVPKWARGIKLSTNIEDFTYVCLVISCFQYYPNFFGGVRVLEEQRVINALLAILKNKYTTKWSSSYACTLRHLVLHVLMKMVPDIEDEYIESNGPNTFLDIIRTFQTNDVDVRILRKCLDALLHILKNTEMVADSIIFNGGVELILDLCEHTVLNVIDEDLGKACLGLAFCILDILYKNVEEKANQTTLTITIAYMKNITQQNRQVPVRDAKEIIFVMNFIWEHIIKVEELAKEFVGKDGTYLMLDIIQKFPFAVKLITLGALVDLCEFGLCIPYLITWKRNDQTLIPMLMQIFREENKQLNVKSGPFGEIIDPKNSVMGTDQWFMTFCTCTKMMQGNACISDLHLSCRPKIYALLQMLDYRHADKVEMANEHYKSYNEELDTADQVTRLVAENFLLFKLGEAWIELREEFRRSHITLTQIDSEILSLLCYRAIKLGEHLQTVQGEIIKHSNRKDLLDEYKLYKHLQDGKLTEALESLSELKAIARCSEHMFRISQKFQQNKQIDTAVRRVSSEAHRTFQYDIRVTPVFRKTVHLSNGGMLSAEDTELPSVSPMRSDEYQYDREIPEDLLESSSKN